MNSTTRKAIGEALENLVARAQNGGPILRLGLMALGSELGAAEVLQGGLMAQQATPGLRVVAIGPKVPGFEALEWLETDNCEANVVAALEKALAEGTVAGAVAMHFPFPIGVATIGRVVTPAKGRPMFIASCTGATATSRGEALLRNAVYGTAVAKACGLAQPSIALLNSEGAGPALRSLTRLQENGYAITLGSSGRGDGGSLLRGNDLVTGAVDVLVCDTLTGNALMKIFATFTTGGGYESTGFGYGPSVGEGWSKVVSIVSRASGAPVVANALALTAQAVQGNLPQALATELHAARAAGLEAELEKLRPKESPATKTVQKPPVVPVDAEIAGVDVLDMEAAAEALWAQGIYAETAMGCTGPVVRVPASAKAEAEKVLRSSGFI